QVHAQHAISLGVRQDLHEAGRLGHGHGSAIGREREAAGLVGDAFFLELLLGLADPGQLRLGVDDPRDGLEVDVAGQAADQLGNRDAFLEALVRQHRAAHAVTHGPDPVDAGVAVLVDLDPATLVELHAGVVGQQALRCRLATDRHQQLVEHQGLLAVLAGVGDVDFLALGAVLDLGLADLGADPDVQALLLELAGGNPGDLGIGGGQEAVDRFQHGDLSAQALPYAAQLQADDAGADHPQALRGGLEIQRTDVVDDVLAVEPGERQFDRVRTGSQDHVGALELDLAAVVLPDLDHVALVQGAEAVVRGDLVGLEQLGDAAGELLNDLVLAADHGRHVDRGVAGGDAVLPEDVPEVPELARAVEQRLGRDAAHAQAGTAQRGLAVLAQRGVDACGLQAQLGGADGGVVTGRAGTDDDDVELICHVRPPYRPSSMRCGFSSWFLMSTRNSTASLPSMMRWS